jgi:hypothetical protein
MQKERGVYLISIDVIHMFPNIFIGQRLAYPRIDGRHSDNGYFKDNCLTINGNPIRVAAG